MVHVSGYLNLTGQLDSSSPEAIILNPIISKIFQKAILKGLYEFVLKHKFLKLEQFGSNKSNTTFLARFNLLTIQLIIQERINELYNTYVLIADIFLDMSKDFVNHNVLLCIIITMVFEDKLMIG